ncbi:MAG: hypothetical protein WA941_05890 [Nitrososphaeraceae archaeon]
MNDNKTVTRGISPQAILSRNQGRTSYSGTRTFNEIPIIGNNEELFKICEAIDCYEAATESIVLSAGKFGMLTLNLCHECAIKKFGSQES